MREPAREPLGIAIINAEDGAGIRVSKYRRLHALRPVQLGEALMCQDETHPVLPSFREE